MQRRKSARCKGSRVLAFAALLCGLVTVGCGASQPVRIFVGTYTTGESHGIYRVDFDPVTGRFATAPGLSAETPNPSFLVLSRDGRRLFAVNELQQFNGEASGAVSAFTVDPSGRLLLINQVSSSGTDPCFIDLDKAGRHVLVANYSSGTIAVLPIDSDGRLQPASSVRRGEGSGPIASRQEGPHAHHFLFDPSGRFVLWTNLGSDQVLVDRYDGETGKLTPNDPPGIHAPPGSGPRHLVWHPAGGVAYLLSELGATVTQLRFDSSTGALTGGQTVGARVPGSGSDNTAAEIVISSDGRFLYTSNRGDDDLAVFAINPKTADLTAVAHVSAGGRTPRHFSIDPSGHWLIVANQNSDSLVVFQIDSRTGIPTRTDATVRIPSPVNVVFAVKRP